MSARYSSLVIFQFPPLREGRQNMQFLLSQPFQISIPAPARGATSTACGRRTSADYFNSRPCARGDDLPFICVFHRIQFQFPPLREGRQVTALDRIDQLLFQFPPLREGRHAIVNSGRKDAFISIPAPARGATMCMVPLNSLSGYFNSRPCARGDLPSSPGWTSSTISIPAPARGATWGDRCLCRGANAISIPAPARGATRSDWRSEKQNSDFNSRPCARGDMPPARSVRFPGISIPAPARGATRPAKHQARVMVISIPAPARGATANLNKSVLRNLCEQANSKDACLLFYDM